MGKIVQEITGAWEDIRARDADLIGKRVRLQVLEGNPKDTVNRLRALLSDTQARARKVTDEDIDAEVAAVRSGR